MEDEDERALETVENREDVREHEGRLVDVEQTEEPGQPEQADQHDGTLHPRPASNNCQRLTLSKLQFSFDFQK